MIRFLKNIFNNSIEYLIHCKLAWVICEPFCKLREKQMKKIFRGIFQDDDI